MSNEPQYTVRWKGKEYGPLSVDTIKYKLSSGEFGMMHEVFIHDEWVTLERFFNSRSMDGLIKIPQSSLHPVIHQNKSPEDEEVSGNPTIQDFTILLGYIFCIAAIFVYPRAMGMTAFMAGALNLVLRNYAHGTAQILLSMACYHIGYHYLAWIR